MISKIKNICQDFKTLFKSDKRLLNDTLVVTIVSFGVGIFLGGFVYPSFYGLSFLPILFLYMIYRNYVPILREVEHEIDAKMKYTTLLKRFNNTY